MNFHQSSQRHIFSLFLPFVTFCNPYFCHFWLSAILFLPFATFYNPYFFAICDFLQSLFFTICDFLQSFFLPFVTFCNPYFLPFVTFCNAYFSQFETFCSGVDLVSFLPDLPIFLWFQHYQSLSSSTINIIISCLWWDGKMVNWWAKGDGNT